MTEGKKYDTDKPRWDLVPFDAVEQIVKVLQMGAEKYGDYNWMHLDNFRERYFAAAMRHIVAWKQEGQFDDESGINHLAHAAVNLIFLIWKDLQNNKKLEVNLKKSPVDVNEEEFNMLKRVVHPDDVVEKEAPKGIYDFGWIDHIGDVKMVWDEYYKRKLKCDYDGKNNETKCRPIGPSCTGRAAKED